MKSLHHLQNWLSRRLPWDPAGLLNGFKMYQTQELVTKTRGGPSYVGFVLFYSILTEASYVCSEDTVAGPSQYSVA